MAKVITLKRTAICSALLLSSQVLAAPPVAVNDARTVNKNTRITINVLSNDFDEDNDALSVVSTTDPANGSVIVNEDGGIRYTPDTDFVGNDTFTYTMQDNPVNDTPVQRTATVTVTVVDVDFGDSSAGDNNVSVGDALDTACSGLQDLSGSERGSGGEQLFQRCQALLSLGSSDPDALGDIINTIGSEESIAQQRLTGDASRDQAGSVSRRLNLLRNGINTLSLNGVAWNGASATGGAAGDDEPSPWSRLGVFANIQQEGAERDVTSLESGYDYDALVLTFGADYALRPNLYIGGAWGWTGNELDYKDDSGSLDSDIYTLIGYASYYVDAFSVDLQLGYGTSEFDSTRRILYTDPLGTVDFSAVGETEGEQLLVNTQFQWEWSKDALTLYPFARFDYLQAEIQGYGENNGGGLELIIGDQEVNQLTVSAGVQGSYAVSQDWGILMPTFQLNLLSEVHSDREPVMGRFAFGPDPDNEFVLNTDKEDTLFYQIGFGTVAVFPQGFQAYFEYQQTFGYENLDAYQVQLGLRYEL